MRLFYLLAFLTIGIINTLAQTNYKPGYVITNSVDTLYGFIDSRGEIRNMKVCNFKETETGDTKTFYPGDITGYRFNTGKFYISKEIETKELYDTVFVEFLLEGIKNLYYYNSGHFSSYFIEKEDSDLMELRSSEQEVEIDGQTYIRTNNRYLGVLNYAFSDYPELLKDIKRTSLSSKGLIKITKKYHEYKCSDEACIVYEKVLPVLNVELKPKIGYSLSFLNFDNSILKEVDLQASSSPIIGLDINFIVPRLNEKLSFLTSFSFNKDYYYGSKLSYSHIWDYYHIYNTNLYSSLALKYTYPKGKFRPEVFAGFYMNSILDSYVDIFQEDVSKSVVVSKQDRSELNKLVYSGICGGIGLEYIINKKWRAFSNISYFSGANTSKSGVESTNQSIRFSTGLTF